MKKIESILENNRFVKLKEFKINDNLTVKLEGPWTNIYVKGKLLRQCKYLMLNIPIENIEDFDDVESIDETADKLDILSENIEDFDNIIEHFIAEYSGPRMFSERQNALNVYLHNLKTLFNLFPELVVVYTNQVEFDPHVFYGNPIDPMGGNTVAHVANTRIFLRIGKGEQRLAKIVNSSYLPSGEAIFSITEGGIKD